MLDNCAVPWTSDLATGGHSFVRMPYVLAGAAGGRVRTGRVLKFDGGSNCDLFVSLLNVFDVGATTFGDQAYCKTSGGRGAVKVAAASPTHRLRCARWPRRALPRYDRMVGREEDGSGQRPTAVSDAAFAPPPPPPEPVLELDLPPPPPQPAPGAPAAHAEPAPASMAEPAVSRSAHVEAAPNRCPRHPGRVAGWSCEGCGRLCPACARAERLSPTKSMTVCRVCGRMAQTITVHRSDRTPLGVLLGKSVLWPLRPVGVGFALVLAALELAPVVGWIACAAAWAFCSRSCGAPGEGRLPWSRRRL